MLDRDADAAEDLGERVPYPFPRDADTDIQQWLAELQREADDVDAALDDALNSFQVENADGDALDELGKDYGVLGKRRGRPNEQYRSYLLGLVAAFDGRGTPPGLRLAIAAGVLADQSDVSLIEDFDTQEYEVVLENEAWAAHSSGTVRDLADLADPSVVSLREPVHNRLGQVAVTIATGETASAEMYRAPEGAVGISAGDTTNRVAAVGLSAPDLGALSTDSWILSVRSAPTATVGIAPGETIIRSMTTASVATVGVTTDATVVRAMTRAPAAAVGVSSSPTNTTSLATRGLSSAALGGLSTTEMDQLA